MTDELVMRSDARKNRERILEVAVVELTADPAVALSTIAKKAGVGQGTFYRHFPTREKLVFEVYQFEMQQVASLAEQLLATKPPKDALREWMDCLVEYAMTKAGLAIAIRQAASVYEFPGQTGYVPVQAAAELLGLMKEPEQSVAGLLPTTFSGHRRYMASGFSKPMALAHRQIDEPGNGRPVCWQSRKPEQNDWR